MKVKKIKTWIYYRIKEIMKIAKIYGEVKKNKMDEEDSLNQIIYIRYKKEKTTWDESPWKIAEIIIEGKRLDMTEGVGTMSFGLT